MDVRPSCFGKEVIYKAVCSSTNTLALQLLYTNTSKVPEGTVVITDHQYKGRGQRGNVWTSEPYKNLTLSLIIRPTFLALQESFVLNIITALAIEQVLASYIPSSLAIKWPNDIYYHDQKLGGILIENLVVGRSISATVIGIGLNVNQTSFASLKPTSLALVCKRTFDLNSLLASLLDVLETNYIQLKEQGIASLQEAYLEKLYWIHEPHTFQDQTQTFQGIIRGIDAIGRLMVEQTAEGRGIIKHYGCQEIAFIA